MGLMKIKYGHQHIIFFPFCLKDKATVLGRTFFSSLPSGNWLNMYLFSTLSFLKNHNSLLATTINYCISPTETDIFRLCPVKGFHMHSQLRPSGPPLLAPAPRELDILK